MTIVVRQNVRGQPAAPALTLDRRRRRLSTVVARHADRRRPFIVSVHRRAQGNIPTDQTVRMRRTWASTLVGADDVVAITYLPLGGGAQGRQQGKQIGAALAVIALTVAATAIAGPLGTFAVGPLTISYAAVATAAVAAVGVGINYLISRSQKAKDKQAADDSIYGVSGGGNLPRPGERIPRLYGRAWFQPDLTQPAYIVNDGEDQILFQRMTLTLGHCRLLTVKVGDAVMWSEGGGIGAAFAGAQVEVIPPGGASTLVPGAVVSSQSVSSQELPRPGDDPAWTGPFPVTSVGAAGAYRIQLDYSLPQGVSVTFSNSSGSQSGPMPWGVEFQAVEIDEDDNPVSAWFVLYQDVNAGQLSTKPLRFTRFVSVDPDKRYAVRGRNLVADSVPGNPRVTAVQNMILWDGLRGWLAESVVRPHVTELAIKVRSGKALGVTAYQAIKVEAVAKLPVWTGAAWTLEETRKAVDAYADIMTGTVGGITYGAGLADGDIALDLVQWYRTTLTEHDTFDGIIRGPVSVYEAASTVLGVIRAQPTRIGNAWSFQRDEARTMRKHVISRRQIVRDSSGEVFDLALSDGSADVIVEYSPDADPQRRGEVRKTFGAVTLTPRRYNIAGVSTYEHAMMLATWYAATAYYRRRRRSVTVELEGRLMRRGDPALVDIWFAGEASRAAGVVARAGTTLTLDTAVTVGADSYIYVRDRRNREFGPAAVTQGAAPNIVVVDADDVAVISDFYDPPIAWADLWQADGDEMTSVLIGPLTEIAEQYLISSVEPQSRDRVNVEAVIDDPQVWVALGEVPPPQPPVPGVQDILGPTVPVVPWVRARAFQHTTSLDMEWAVGNARGAARYVVRISYDGGVGYDLVSDGASTSGTMPIRDVADVDVLIEAFAVSSAGVVGPTVQSSFRTFKPVISSDVASILIQIADLQAQLRHDIEQIAATGAGTIRAALRELDNRVEQLAADAMTANVTHDEARTQLIAATGKTIAAIRREEQVRTSADEAFASSVTTILARLTTAEGSLTGQAGAISELITAVTANGNDIAVQAGQITTLNSRLTTAEGTVVGQATAINNLTTTVIGTGGQISATAANITALSTTVGGHTSTLTAYGASIDGISAQWGVTIEIDGTIAAGFRLTGFRRMDGTVTGSFGIYGDLVVDGTISGTKLQAYDIIAYSAQIGNLTVDNINIKNGAVSGVYAASGGSTASITLNSRGTGSITVMYYYTGSAITEGIENFTLQLWDNTAGVMISTTPVSRSQQTTGLTGPSGYTPTTGAAITAPGAGSRTYEVRLIRNLGGVPYIAGVLIVATENSK